MNNETGFFLLAVLLGVTALVNQLRCVTLQKIMDIQREMIAPLEEDLRRIRKRKYEFE